MAIVQDGVVSHAGFVVGLRSSYSCGDTDYYAVYWNPETEKIGSVNYGTTRFYERNSASVDASPEVMEKAKAYCYKRLNDLTDKCKAAWNCVVQKGDVVRIDGFKRGEKKDLNGLDLEVFWVGVNKFTGCDSYGVRFNGKAYFVDNKYVFKNGVCAADARRLAKIQSMVSNAAAVAYIFD